MRKILFYPLMFLVPLSMAYAAGVTKNAKCEDSYNYTDGINRYVTSNYGYREAVKTSTGYASSFHRGVDIRVGQNGQPSTANSYMGGTITKVGYNPGGYGNYVIVTSADGKFQTLYAHASSISVKVGDSVSAGQVVADYSGPCTGSCTGAHIHYETQVKNENGDWVKVDPRITEQLVAEGKCPGTDEFTSDAITRTESNHGVNSSQLVSGASALEGDICK